MTLPIVAAVVISGKKNSSDIPANDAVMNNTDVTVSEAEPMPEPDPEPVSGAEAETETETEPESEPVPMPLVPEKIPLSKYEPYLEINPYVSGWLEIDGSKIDDAVVYTPGSQNYFLHRALDGSPLERGTFFIAINWQDGFNNTLIYGHNMKDGSGFGSLPRYADKKYGMDHSVIRFDTLYDEKEYELFAVFYSQIDEEELETEEDRAEADRMIAEKSLDEKREQQQEQQQQEQQQQEQQQQEQPPEAEEPVDLITEEELTVKDLNLHRDFGDEDIYRSEKDEDNGRFRYYYYNDLSDRDDFEYFVDNVRQRALYDTGEDVSWGDELLTLSTCSYHVRNGRLVVVAVHHPD